MDTDKSSNTPLLQEIARYQLSSPSKDLQVHIQVFGTNTGSTPMTDLRVISLPFDPHQLAIPRLSLESYLPGTSRLSAPQTRAQPPCTISFQHPSTWIWIAHHGLRAAESNMKPVDTSPIPASTGLKAGAQQVNVQSGDQYPLHVNAHNDVKKQEELLKRERKKQARRRKRQRKAERKSQVSSQALLTKPLCTRPLPARPLSTQPFLTGSLPTGSLSAGPSLAPVRNHSGFDPVAKFLPYLGPSILHKPGTKTHRTDPATPIRLSIPGNFESPMESIDGIE